MEVNDTKHLYLRRLVIKHYIRIFCKNRKNYEHLLIDYILLFTGYVVICTNEKCDVFSFLTNNFIIDKLKGRNCVFCSSIKIDCHFYQCSNCKLAMCPSCQYFTRQLNLKLHIEKQTSIYRNVIKFISDFKENYKYSCDICCCDLDTKTYKKSVVFDELEKLCLYCQQNSNLENRSKTIKYCNDCFKRSKLSCLFEILTPYCFKKYLQ